MYKAYLLLRGNHQAGPYSLEELLQHNLQPGDLIWVEGRSTCWLFPHEIDALQPFVASPFSETPPATIPSIEQPASLQGPASLATPVAVPNGRSAATIDRHSGNEAPSDHLNGTLTATNRRKASRGRMLAGSLLLALAGIAAYFYLNSDKEAPTRISDAQVTRDIPSATAPAGDTEPLPEVSSDAAVGKGHTVTGKPAVRSNKSVRNQATRPSAPIAAPPPSSPSTEPDETVRIPRGETPEVVVAPSAETGAPKPVKEKKKLRESLRDLFAKKKGTEAGEETPPATNRQANRRAGDGGESTASADLVDLSSNEPDNWMMGVKGLKLTLRNRNPVALRSASVVVTYYSNQNKVLDRQTLVFQNVAANGRQTLPAPDHKYADHVDYQLGEIVGKEDRYARQ